MLTPEEKKARAEARKEARALARIEARKEEQRNQKPVKSITISIEWRKSRMWGNNPHAQADITYTDGHFKRVDGFTASGCGYDKESTVIAEIFNACLAYKLYAPHRPAVVPYGIRFSDKFPAMYEGGVGTSCYTDIAEYIGGKFENVASGKTFDAYRYTEGA